MDLNHFTISGNVTRDLELRYLPSGTATVTFTVACNFVRHDEHGDKHERTAFVPVTTFGKQAERDAKYLQKGSPVAVEGRIESWYQREEKRGDFNFKATNVQYGGRGVGDAPRTAQAEEQRASVDNGSNAEREQFLAEMETAEKKAAKPAASKRAGTNGKGAARVKGDELQAADADIPF